jgi:hypothetical protein
MDIYIHTYLHTYIHYIIENTTTQVVVQEQQLEEILFGKPDNNTSGNIDDILFETENQVEALLDSHEKLQSGDDDDEAVWRDDEEDQIEIDLNSSARLKKLKKSLGGANKVTGRQLTALLQERYDNNYLIVTYICRQNNFEMTIIFQSCDASANGWGCMIVTTDKSPNRTSSAFT